MFTEDHTFQDLCENSVMEWLTEMEEHEDLAVRGGVKVTKDYILSLKKKIEILEEKSVLKDQYLKQMKNK